MARCRPTTDRGDETGAAWRNSPAAVLSRLAIQARAGTRAELAQFARKAVLAICGQP